MILAADEKPKEFWADLVYQDQVVALPENLKWVFRRSHVTDNPLKYRDPHGDTLYLCSSPARGINDLRHSYIYDDRGDGKSCGRNGSYGYGTTGDSLPGPHNGHCTEIPGSNDDDAADEVMRCICNPATANPGQYVPGFNDCHNSTHNCITSAGLADPGTPGGRMCLPTSPCEFH